MMARGSTEASDLGIIKRLEQSLTFTKDSMYEVRPLDEIDIKERLVNPITLPTPLIPSLSNVPPSFQPRRLSSVPTSFQFHCLFPWPCILLPSRALLHINRSIVGVHDLDIRLLSTDRADAR